MPQCSICGRGAETSDTRQVGDARGVSRSISYCQTCKLAVKAIILDLKAEGSIR